MLIGYVALPWTLIYLGNFFAPSPPRPEITYGEFPFRLVYEINGQRKVIEDTLICEFEGFGFDEGRGKYRKWKQYLASGNERVTLLKVDDNIEIYYNPGSAKYYMGDMESYVEFNHMFPNAAIYRADGEYGGTISAEHLLKEYNIKLINWEYTPPITNRFLSS